MGLRLLASWDFEFEIRQGLGNLSPVSVVCCQVRVHTKLYTKCQRFQCVFVCVCVCVYEVVAAAAIATELLVAPTKSIHV